MAGNVQKADGSQQSVTQSLKIPLNLKNAYRPFVLDPSNALAEISQASAPEGQPQLFSYKQSWPRLGILPSSWAKGNPGAVNSILKKDISMQLLYGMKSDGQMKNTKIGLDHFFSHIPMVQIREYQQDSKLNQVFSLIDSLVDTGKEMAQSDSGSGVIGMLSQFKESAASWWKAFKWIVTNPDIFAENVLKDIKTSRKLLCKEVDKKSYFSVLKIPHIMYYQMISSLSLNIFELPFNGEITRSANGHGGWGGRGSKGALTQQGTGIFSALNPIISYFADNIKITLTPTWDGVDDQEGVQFQFTVNLFNDSIDATCANFIFVNTLLPGAMWTQYHIFTQSPSLYDVKVDGLGRYFMCSGSFKVEYKGVLRTPSRKFVETLCKKHLNKMYEDQINPDYLFRSGIVKIPDVYQITLQFKSLLPDNFNNFIYSNCANEPISQNDPIFQKSAWEDVSSALKEGINTVKEDLDARVVPFMSYDEKSEIVSERLAADNYESEEQKRKDLEWMEGGREYD